MIWFGIDKDTGDVYLFERKISRFWIFGIGVIIGAIIMKFMDLGSLILQSQCVCTYLNQTIITNFTKTLGGL